MHRSAPGPASDPAAGLGASTPAAAAPTATAGGYASTAQRVRGRSLAWRVLGFFSTVACAACLIATTGLVIFGGAVYESTYGRLPAFAMVYGTWWFAGLFVLLAVNIAGAAAVRWPWRRHQAGFVVVHCGLLLLILGFFLAGNDRLDGSLVAPPGRQVADIELPQDAISIAIPAPDGGPERRAVATFDATSHAGYPTLPRVLLGRAMPWLAPLPDPGIHVLAQPLQLLDEARDGVAVLLLAVCDTARATGGYLATPASEPGGPACELSLAVRSALMPGAGEQPLEAHWLAPQGERVVAIGPLTATIASCRASALVADFLHPPIAASLPPTGQLRIYWQGACHVEAVPDPAQLPLTRDLAADLALEFDHVLPHARVVKDSLTEDPAAELDPFVQLRIGMGPPASRSWREVVVAARYLLPAPGVDYPEFLYLHPGVLGPATGAVQRAWLQALCGPDDALNLRWFTHSHGLVGVQTIGADAPRWSGLLIGSGGGPMQLRATVAWLPHAQPGPEPVVMQAGEEDKATRWVELAVARGGRSGHAWIAKGDASPIHLAGGSAGSDAGDSDSAGAGAGAEILVRYDAATYSLKDHHGFTLQLERFDEATDPGGEQAASFASHVWIRGLDESQRDEALSHLRAGEARAQARLADDPIGRWLPPALLGILHPAATQPPVIAERHALISMNQPLQLGGVTLYQASFLPETDGDGQPTGRQISVFTVAEDHGRLCKYLGSATLVGGILLMYFMRRRAH